MRKAFIMQLYEGFEAEYIQRHNPIWKELIDLFEAHGVHNYSIFLNQETLQLFGYVEIESVERWEAIAQTEVCQRWWKYMDSLMRYNPDGTPWSMELQEVFHLD